MRRSTRRAAGRCCRSPPTGRRAERGRVAGHREVPGPRAYPGTSGVSGRRDGEAAGSGSGGIGLLTRPVTSSLVDDAAPVAGFMAGKLVSHVAFGALLGLFGAALQPNFRVRAFMQMGAGVLTILMAANMFGLLGKRSFVFAPPASFTRPSRRRSSRPRPGWRPG